jgi:hypothetical protein
VDDRRLNRLTAVGLLVLGLALLVAAAWLQGYWQSLLINLGTGVLLFVALEHVLYTAGGFTLGVLAQIGDLMRRPNDGTDTHLEVLAERLSYKEVANELPPRLTAVDQTVDSQRLAVRMAALERVQMTDRARALAALLLLSSVFGPSLVAHAARELIETKSLNQQI